MEIFIAELQQNDSDDWITLSYHKTFEGAVRAFGGLKEEHFPPVKGWHNGFGSIDLGVRIWKDELID